METKSAEPTNVPVVPPTIVTPTPPKLYIPDFADRTSNVLNAQRRLLICGMSGEGKSFQSLTTAPNPILADFDNSIADPRLIKLDAPHLRFFDPEWCEKRLKKSVRCNALLEFIKGDGMKLAKEQTLITDSLSTLNDDVQAYQWRLLELKCGSGKEPDGFEFWDKIRDYYIDLFNTILKLKCNVIMTAHLTEVRHKTNGAFMHYSPLLEGSMKQRIGQFFTDVVRVRVISKDKGNDVFETKWDWQIKPDDKFPMAKSRSITDKKYIPADFRQLMVA